MIFTPKQKMDLSPSELLGEIDHLSRNAAIEYVLLPEQIKKLEGQLLVFSNQVENLRGELYQMVQVLKALVA
ncbi:MAG: hypothetical protein QCH99_08590 [Candidatus Bathyarchaeota archaeon]|nr:hypothetical protein [Candidatus Bathyarchaeum tardum]WGM89931.1 MAG: hypothetical protein NUK63_02080 [Candidatus Bathyarchaeum tardum]